MASLNHVDRFFLLFFIPPPSWANLLLWMWPFLEIFKRVHIAYYSTFGNSTKNTISRVNIMYFSKCKYLTFPKAKKNNLLSKTSCWLVKRMILIYLTIYKHYFRQFAWNISLIILWISKILFKKALLVMTLFLMTTFITKDLSLIKI